MDFRRQERTGVPDWITPCTSRAVPLWLPVPAGRRHWRMEQPLDIRSHSSDHEAPPVSAERATAQRPQEERVVQTDLPRSLPILREEIALLRAYLADEINALLFDED